MDLPKNILDKLHCCECNKLLTVLPVHSYESGEFVCGRCPPNLEKKPNRDFGYELFAQSINFPCQFKSYGCIETLKLDQVPLHQSTCDYRRLPCPHAECKGHVAPLEFEIHYQAHHDAFIIKNIRPFTIPNKLENWEENYLLKDYSCIFVVELKKKKEQFFVNIYSLNQSAVTYKYDFTITLENGDEIELLGNKVENKYGQLDVKVENSYVLDINGVHKCSPLTCEICLYEDQQSKKGSQKLDVVNEYILKHINCPGCSSYMSAPIYQCNDGHVFCKLCKSKSNQCPKCHTYISYNTRNQVLESIAENVLYKCKYAGCAHIYTFKERNYHENNCEYGPYNCPMCEFQDQFKCMIKHITAKHKQTCIQHNTNQVNVMTNNEMHIILRGNAIFILNHSFTQNSLKIDVTFYGPKRLPNNYYYTIDMLKGDKYKIIVKSKCLGWNADMKKATIELPFTTLLPFKQLFNLYSYNVTVTEENLRT